MKKISIVLFLSFAFCKNVFYCQSNDIYVQCLLDYVDSLIVYGVYDKGDTVLVYDKDFISEIPKAHNGLYIRTINGMEVHEKTKRKKSIGLIEVQPLEFKDGMLSLHVVSFGVSRKRNHYTKINNGHHRYKIVFDCLRQDYSFELKGSH